MREFGREVKIKEDESQIVREMGKRAEAFVGKRKKRNWRVRECEEMREMKRMKRKKIVGNHWRKKNEEAGTH